MVSCEDYLTIYPTTSITEEEFWNTRNDVENVRAAAYFQLTKCTDKILTWGEFRSDNVELSKMEKANYRYMLEAVLQPSEDLYNWAPFYKGINFCNKVLENGQRMVDAGTDPAFTNVEWQSMKAEMVSLRALYYFYLVRSFRDVPFVTKSISTDDEGMKSRPVATPGQVLMDSLIREVEAVLPTAAINYGSTSANKGRWTRTSIHALLADMYLWRAGMVSKAGEKGFPVTNEKGETLTAAQEQTLSSELLKKSISHADYVLNRLKEDYDRNLDLTNVPHDDKRRTFVYPLIQSFSSSIMAEDLAYAAIFGVGNSSESVIELQYDGKNVVNKTITDMFYGNESGPTAGLMMANPALFAKSAPVDPVKGYGKTDLRYFSYGMHLASGRSETVPIVKGYAMSAIAMFPEGNQDVTKAGSYTYASQSANSQSYNWPIYRLSDMMTIKAEAMARLSAAPFDSPEAHEAYRILDELFRRNNPAADTLNASADLYCKRLRSAAAFKAEDEKVTNGVPGWKDRYADYGSPLKLAFNERQREFLGEGKRWYDIVRECEFRGATKDVLSDWVGLTSTVRNRLRSIWSLYNPIYLEELKVNGRDYGTKTGNLVQNPAWVKYMPKS